MTVLPGIPLGLLDDLKRDESLRLKLYRDSVLGKLTIGWGRNIEDCGISRDEAEVMLLADVDEVVRDLDLMLPWWRGLSPDQQRGLANMAFNLGLPKLLKFKDMLSALKRGNGLEAATAALNSRWARQVGERADRVATRLRRSATTKA
jgi:lysozyme